MPAVSAGEATPTMGRSASAIGRRASTELPYGADGKAQVARTSNTLSTGTSTLPA
jgi:hypothetical protein